MKTMLSTITRSVVKKGKAVRPSSASNVVVRPMAGTAESRTSAVSPFAIVVDNTSFEPRISLSYIFRTPSSILRFSALTFCLFLATSR